MDMMRKQALRRVAMLGPIALASVGCASVPRGQVEEARGQVLALRTELAQTKDVAAKLRTQNREISARAVEDSRRLTSLEESNERLEQSVASYQQEREQYAAALDRIKREIASASSEAVRRQ